MTTSPRLDLQTVASRAAETQVSRTQVSRRRAAAVLSRFRESGWLLWCAAAIPILMTGSWLVADPLQPSRYSPIRQSVSVLAGHAGQQRWIVTAALFVVGACYLLVAAGLPPLGRPARIGLLAAGIAAIGIAASPEPVHGSTPQHLAFTAFGAIVIAIWPFLAIRPGSRRWAPTSVPAASVAGAVFLGLLAWTFVQTRDGATLGLAERLSSSVQITWPVVVAWYVFRARHRAPAPIKTMTAIAHRISRLPIRHLRATLVRWPCR